MNTGEFNMEDLLCAEEQTAFQEELEFHNRMSKMVHERSERTIVWGIEVDFYWSAGIGIWS
jgi:hypothetical protein